MYSPEGIFPLGITHPSRPAAKLNLGKSIPFWMASLDIISEPPRTKYSEEPELYRFLARTKTCHEIRIGLSTYLVTGQKILLERIVCVQSRKIFFTPEQPLHPDLAQILDR